MSRSAIETMKIERIKKVEKTLTFGELVPGDTFELVAESESCWHGQVIIKSKVREDGSYGRAAFNLTTNQFMSISDCDLVAKKNFVMKEVK